MIIEGKHSELGQGIFISDIQDGSNADKVSVLAVFICATISCSIVDLFLNTLQAGLLIGEMILAVNKDLLVDCNYDSVCKHWNIRKANIWA